MTCILRWARYVWAVVALSSGVLAQSPPSRCPSNVPVDEVIAEMHKQKPPRNKSLAPENVCVWGWCRQPTQMPLPKPNPKTEQQVSPPPEQQPAPDSNDYSTSKSESDRCLDAMESTIAAAQDVDTGDFYAKDKNYKGALMRYQSALEKKPGDSAIYVRLGRAYEHLRDVPQAIENYSTAANLPGPEKWVGEAKTALARLKVGK